MEQAYPLHWPAGRPRTQSHHMIAGPFKINPQSARRRLSDEISRMSGRNVVISSNKTTRQDGEFHAQVKEPDDPGVAVYFERDGNRVCFACDQYDRLWKNIHAITKTIEAMRGIERWGSKEMLDRAFSGFTALPPPISMGGPQELPRPWHEVLGCSASASHSEVRTAYRDKMRDATDVEKYAINAAYDQAKTQTT